MVSLAKQVGIKNSFKYSLEEMPIDLFEAIAFSLRFLNIVENIPEEYLPKQWQWYFDDEIEKCIKRWRDSFSSTEKTNQENVVENEYATELLKILNEGGG